jgi:hypothetical protein
MKVIHETLRVHSNVISTFVLILFDDKHHLTNLHDRQDTTFLCLSLTPVFRFQLVTVLLVSVLSRLRFVNEIVRVVVSYFVIHYCLAVYSQYYFILISNTN